MPSCHQPVKLMDDGMESSEDCASQQFNEVPKTGVSTSMIIYLVKLYRPHTPHPKWWFSMGNPFISGKSRLVKYYNLARYM